MPTIWKLVRGGLRRVGRPGLALAGFRVEGHLPPGEGPLIIASNHAAYVDTVYLHIGLGQDFVVCGAKPRLFRTAPLRALMKLANVIEVVDEAGFLREVDACLARGERVLVYPEMGRRPAGLGAFVPWFAEAALRRGVGIVPVHVHGTALGHSWPVRLRVGGLIEARSRDSAEALCDRVRQAIVELGS